MRLGEFKRYEKYKDSGVEWIGEVPEGWEISPLKHITEFVNGAAFKPDDWEDEGIPIVRIENLNGGMEFNRTKKVVDKRYLLKNGDLVFGWSGNKGTSFGPFIWYGEEPRYYLNQHIFRFEGFNVDKNWFYWVLKGVTNYIESKTHGIIGLVHVTKGELGNIPIPLISNSEQISIGNFLNEKTSEIDSLIADKEKLIELLQEQRQAIISEAVTKGLDKNVKMKDSGIEWIGEVPEGWEVVNVRNLLRSNVIEIQDGNHGELHPVADDYVVKGIPFIMANNIRLNEIDMINCKFISEEQAMTLRIGFSRAGDVLLTHKGTIGEVALVPDDMEFPFIILSPQVTYYRVRKQSVLFNKYLSLFFQSGACRKQLDYISSMQSTRAYIGIIAQRELVIPIPQLIEQIEIVKKIEQKIRDIDSLIKNIEIQIKDIKEYRQALISEAVTGKIMV